MKWADSIEGICSASTSSANLLGQAWQTKIKD
jgi:hypothetical protein